MWNLSMWDPLPKNSHSRLSSNNGFGHSNSQSNSDNKKGTKKSRYCWNWNKGMKCKFGNKCRFMERCSYCDSNSHGLYNCPKAQKKGDESPGQTTQAPGAVGPN